MTLIRYTDIYPSQAILVDSDDQPILDANGRFTRPDGVPSDVKLRTLVTDQWITFGWLYGSQMRRHDIAIDPADIPDTLTHDGGTVNGIKISRVGICSTCGGGSRVIGWQPFPDEVFVEEPRKELAVQLRAEASRERSGVPPVRYTRNR